MGMAVRGNSSDAGHSGNRTWERWKAHLTPRAKQAVLLIVFGATGLSLIAGGGLAMYAASVAREVAGIDVQGVPQMMESTRVYDREGRLIHEFYKKRRTVVPLSLVSRRALQAIQATEDRNFYSHPGFDLKAIARAALANLLSGRVLQGASTITQQLARAIFLSSERSYRRKIQELWLARKIEREYSKQQILEFYINRIYLGSGFYGLEAAAAGYFGKRASELTLSEAALLAGIIKAPSVYSPHRALRRSMERRNHVLRAMVTCGYITSEEAVRARHEEVRILPQMERADRSSYAIDLVREELIKRFGTERTYSGGLRVYTSIASRIQAQAEDVVDGQLRRLEKDPSLAPVSRASYLQKLAKGKKASPDYLQGALLSIDAGTGDIYAVVGGRNYGESQFNRAVHARRQPGSAFKPLVYAAALQAGMTPATKIDAAPAEYLTPEGPYTPVNSSESEYGNVSLRQAVYKSINTAAVRVGQQVGLQNVIRCARDFRIEAPLPPVVSLPLGAGEMTLYELTHAYSAFANGGKTVKPRIILRVEDSEGRVLLSNPPSDHRVLDEQTAYLMASMLSDAVVRGTGYTVSQRGYRGAVAGKTGTTDEYHDAWFIGFTPRIVTGVWVGFDAPREITANGYASTLAVPLWTTFMKRGFAKPPEKFPVPAGLVKAEVCRESGELATANCRVYEYYGEEGEPYETTYMESFTSYNVPPPCRLHSGWSVASGQTGTDAGT
jgi:penicillin-binding protein 1A